MSAIPATATLSKLDLVEREDNRTTKNKNTRTVESVLTLYEPTEDTFRRIRERYQSFSECLILNTSSVKSVSLNKDDSIMYITNVLISQDHPEYQEFEVMMAMGVFTHLLDGTGRLTRL